MYGMARRCIMVHMSASTQARNYNLRVSNMHGHTVAHLY